MKKSPPNVIKCIRHIATPRTIAIGAKTEEDADWAAKALEAHEDLLTALREAESKCRSIELRMSALGGPTQYEIKESAVLALTARETALAAIAKAEAEAEAEAEVAP